MIERDYSLKSELSRQLHPITQLLCHKTRVRAEEKLWYTSVILAYLALGTNFLLRTMEGSALALALSSLSLLLYVYQWSPSKHLLRTKLNREDFFFAATSVILFSFLNVVTKILLPIAMAISFTVALGIIGLLAGGAFGMYGIYLYVNHTTHHREFMENLDNFLLDVKLRDQYERLGNSVIVASTFLALDAPDLMLILAAIMSSSKLIVSAISRGLVRLQKIIPSFISQSTKVGWRLRQFSRRVERLDLEEAFWTRVLYVTQYKCGFSYFLLALMSGLPAIIYSYSVDFLMPEPGKLAVFLLLSLPGVVVAYALKLPKGLVSTAKEAGRLRQILFVVSLAAPFAAIPVVFIVPGLLEYSGMASFSDLEFAGRFFGFMWLAITPIVIALPIYSMVAAVEFEDYPSFIRRVRLCAMSPSLATSLMAASATLVSNLSFPASLVIFALYVSFACYFYPLVVLAATRVLHDVERRTDKPMQQWIGKVRGPRWSADLLAVALGSFFFPLFIFVGAPYPWVMLRQGFLFPHVLPILFWIAGGVTVMLFISPVSQPRGFVDCVRVGLAGSLGVTGQAILFLGLPYAVTIWAPWVILIPPAYAIGAMIPMVATHLLCGVR